MTYAIVQAGYAIGDRVCGGEGEDFDVGVVIEANAADADIPHGDDAVFVAWRSGVRTWTPVADLDAYADGTGCLLDEEV